MDEGPALAAQIIEMIPTIPQLGPRENRRRGISLREVILSRAAVRANGCIEWTGGLGKKGYATVKFERKIRTVHRTAYEVFKGSVPEGLHVLHRCDNRKCLNPDHLFLGTNRDNMDDMKSKGRHNHGSGHSRAKLTDEAVLDIRASKESAATLASRHGVTDRTIRRVRKGASWVHL